MMGKSRLVILSVAISLPGAVAAQTDKTQNLKDVVVVAEMSRKDAVSETIFITDSLRKGTSSAIQLLAKLPGISTDWGTDEVKIGKDRDVHIIVNGKEVKREYAVSLNPNRIKKVEILRNPTGKYAEYPVVLNIELNKDYIGWDAGAFSRNMYSFRNSHSNRETAGANFTYSSRKVNFYGNFDLTHKQLYQTAAYEYTLGTGKKIATGSTDYTAPNLDDKANVGSLALGLDYKLAARHVLSLQGWLEVKDNRGNEQYHMSKANEAYDLSSSDDYKTTDYTAGLYYKGTFADKLLLNSELVYNRYNIHEDHSVFDNGISSLNPYKGYKDYGRFDVSARYIFNTKWTLMAEYTLTQKKYTNFDRETQQALYKSRETRSKPMVALSYRPLSGVSVLAGTHLLTVDTKNSLTGEDECHTSWMPVGKVYWRVAKWMALSANYYCDVEYPNLDQLSPVQWKANDILWHIGNSALKPRIMHYSEINIDFVKWLKVNYMFKRSKNEIVDFFRQENSRMYQTQANCNYSHNYIGIESEHDLTKGLNWSLVASYQWYKRYQEGNAVHHGRTCYLDTQLQWNVPKSKWTLMASYFLRHDKFPMLQGEQYNEDESLCFAVSYPLFKGKLPVSLTVRVPSQLISKQTYTHVELPDFSYSKQGDNRVNAFCALLNIRYSLGNGKSSKMNYSKNTDAEK